MTLAADGKSMTIVVNDIGARTTSQFVAVRQWLAVVEKSVSEPRDLIQVSGTAEEKNFANLAESSAEAEARGPRFQMGVLIAPGATTFTRMLRGARSAAMERAIETRPPLVAAYAATPGWPR